MTDESSRLRTMDGIVFRGKRTLVRADLNVPMTDCHVTDASRLQALCPTIRELQHKGARIILCSHLGRPKGKPVPSMSLAPVAKALAGILGQSVRFAGDCIGPLAQSAVDQMADGDVLVIENTRYHPGEEANDPVFARQLSSLADLYVNDAFSAAHRAHASTEAVARLLPSCAGRLMQKELEALDSVLGRASRPLVAVVGGVKIASKLALLRNLVQHVDRLVIGGAMANTFLAATGIDIGESVEEPGMHAVALEVLATAQAAGCDVVLPVDVVVASRLDTTVPYHTVPVGEVPEETMILDIGEATGANLARYIEQAHTLVWNGPLGAFETPPFDTGTVAFARAVATATVAGRLRSVAGGGDTVASLRHAGVMTEWSYVSMAGGAFLEWLEGRTLPGVVAVSDNPVLALI